MECGHDVLGGRSVYGMPVWPGRDRIVAYAARLWRIFESGLS